MAVPKKPSEPQDLTPAPAAATAPAASTSGGEGVGQGLLARARNRLKNWPDPRVVSLVRRATAEARAAALERVPLPLYEVVKLGGIDPFVARATAVTYRSSGRHFLILAGPPIGDGGRGAQLAFELLARAHRVTYVHRFPARERQRRKQGFVHENFTHMRFADFSARAFAMERRASERLVVITELPLPEYRACALWLKRHGAQSVYDVVEDWPATGAGWYTQRTESGLLKEADLVVASGRALKDAVETRSFRDVALIPNAVNSRLFARGRVHPRPSDLPRSSALFVYAGTMWNDWIAWDWLVALARAKPDGSVVLLGDYRGQCKNPPRNMAFLGHRPQADLPAYFAHCQVGLVPYRADRMTRPAVPLKVFEYLAMGLPVVSADLPELAGVPGVALAHSAEEFVAAALQARDTHPSEEALAPFVSENSWKARVRQLERIVAG